jgi:glycosyltransferase involved in cell wall biosynthesis
MSSGRLLEEEHMDESKGALWIAHNYSSQTGYAWNNIFALFSSIAESSSKPIVLSYACDASHSIRLRSPCAVEQFDFADKGIFCALRALRLVLRHGVRHVYLTDQPPTRPLYLALRLAGVRTILIHNRISVPCPLPAQADGWLRRTLKGIWARLPGLSANRMYAVSDFVANRLAIKARVPRSRIVRIHNGIDTKRFNPAPGERGTIFSGCRADRHKGVNVLIDACAELRRRGVDFHLRYAGDGPDLQALQDDVVARGLHGHVTFLGKLDPAGIAAELRRAALICIPANWGDACPSAVLEAMASGKPVVATQAGGIPELIEDGVSGVLVRPGDASALANALAAVLADPDAESLGVAARTRAVKLFDIRRYHGDVICQMQRDFA